VPFGKPATGYAVSGIDSAVWPVSTTSCSGKRSASSPNAPTGLPNRSPSWLAGVLWSRRPSAGETMLSPGPGSCGMPGGNWMAEAGTPPVSATSTRMISLPPA